MNLSQDDQAMKENHVSRQALTIPHADIRLLITYEQYFSILCVSVQAANQNALRWPASNLQLRFLRQNRALQSVVFARRHRQPSQSQWKLWRQRRLHQRQRQALARPGLPTNVQPRNAGRQHHLPTSLRGVLRQRGGRLSDQVRVHAERHSQEAVPRVRRHRLRVPLWGGLLWGLQSLFQKDNTRYFPTHPRIIIISVISPVIWVFPLICAFSYRTKSLSQHLVAS